MSALAFILALSGFLPAPHLALESAFAGLGERPRISIACEADQVCGMDLKLDLDLSPEGAFDEIGRVLDGGIRLADVLRVVVEGQPSAPFLTEFLHAHEIRQTAISAEAIASSVMVSIRIDVY